MRAGNLIDLTGRQVNDWTVIQHTTMGSRKVSAWLCRCVCGVERPVAAANIRSGRSRGCGCKKLARIGEANTHHGHSKGGKVSSEYVTWRNMHARCYNPKSKAYRHYGARGIRVCNRWRCSFENFLADMGPRPDPKFTIERKNNDLGYSPDNCIWADCCVQNNHRTNVKLYEYHGLSLSLSQWARLTPVKRSCLNMRVRTGWTTEEILTTPSNGRRGCLTLRPYLLQKIEELLVQPVLPGRDITQVVISSRPPNTAG